MSQVAMFNSFNFIEIYIWVCFSDVTSFTLSPLSLVSLTLTLALGAPKDNEGRPESKCKRTIVGYSPCDDAIIFFLSSTEASLLHKDGYRLYREPLNIRR